LMLEGIELSSRRLEQHRYRPSWATIRPSGLNDIAARDARNWRGTRPP
jgi:hypothetical protein